MGTRRLRTGVFCAVAIASVLVAASATATAEEVVGKWRLEFKVGGFDPGDSIRSDAANSYIFDNGVARVPITDPRPDIAANIEGRMSADPRYDLRASYGLKAFKNSELVLGVSVGYVKTRIKNLELAYALDIEDPSYFNPVFGTYNNACETAIFVTGSTVPFCVPFNADRGGTSNVEEWHYEPIDAGELTQVPVTIDLTIRFLPTKRFNPYLSAGIGYLFTKFDESARWTELANQLDASYVDETVRGGSDPSLGVRALAGNAHDLKRPEISRPDGLNLELRGGVEWQWKPRTAFFLEMGFNWAAEEVTITVDGKKQFGTSTPDGILVNQDNLATAVPRGGLPARIICGGVNPPPGVTTPPGALCPGAGEYYFNGGVLDYGGFSWQVGVRFTL